MKLFIQTGTYALFAWVEVQVEESHDGEVRVRRPCRPDSGVPWSPSWAEGVVFGAEVALATLHRPACTVTFTRLVGTPVDTDAAAMSAAAVLAVLDACGRGPPDRATLRAWYERHRRDQRFADDQLPSTEQLVELASLATMPRAG